MQAELADRGRDATIVIINTENGVKYQNEFTDRFTGPLLQDTVDAGAWNLLGGKKDDFFFFDSSGSLVAYLPIDGTVSINMQTAEGYANVRDLLMVID